MIEWKEYPHDRKICDKGGYAVIVPTTHLEKRNSDGIMPIFCEVCGIRFGHREDEGTYKKFRCCSPCADKWAYSNKEKWYSGWRPNKEEIEVVIAKRSFVDLDIVFE